MFATCLSCILRPCMQNVFCAHSNVENFLQIVITMMRLFGKAKICAPLLPQRALSINHTPCTFFQH